MIKLVGFKPKSGEFTSDTGEVINWSNRMLRCISDENLEEDEYGLKVLEQKMKTSYVCKSLGISENSSEAEVNKALNEILDCEISMTIGILNGKFDIVGFKVLET